MASMESINNNFVNYKDFDIEKLVFSFESKPNSKFNFRTFDIKYKYPDGEIRNFRLRSPSLFSYGIKRSQNAPDFFITLKAFYDEENPTKNENEFKKILDDISRTLREKIALTIPPSKNGNLENIEIVNERGFFLPKLFQNKTYNDAGKFTGGDIESTFYKKIENRKMEVVPASFLDQKNCFVVSVIEISDIFVRDTFFKIRMFLSDAIVIKTDISSPFNFVKTSGLTIDSKDER